MKVECPKCKATLDLKQASRFRIFKCGCGHRFRGIHANQANWDWWSKRIFGGWSQLYNDPTLTPCPHCHEYIPCYAKRCGKCTQPLDTSPASQQVQTQQPRQSAVPSMPMGCADGRGPCPQCGTVFNMDFNNPTCPGCGYRLTHNEAFSACASHSG